jgi:hypothetical protein
VLLIIAAQAGRIDNLIHKQRVKEITMLSYRLVRLIEYHSDSLAAGLLRKVQASDRTGAYRNIPPDELKQRVYEIYRHLGAWLIDKSAAEIELRYIAIGAHRAEQGIPFSELVWAIILTKHNLSEFIDDVTFPGRIVDISDKLEISHLLNEFFDEALHAAAEGHEMALRKKAEAEMELQQAV